MAHELEVLDDAGAVASEAARRVAAWAREAVAAHGAFSFAVSGGSTPWAMFAALAGEDVPWEQVTLFQVDERVAPDGDPERNLTQLRAAIGGAAARIVAMPVGAADLDAAAARYASQLPERFDLIHLGLGADGHTASLVPGDGVLGVTDRLVAPTAGLYQGRRRLTLTYPALTRAERLLWLVTGADKAPALAALLAGDPAIPAGRVEPGGASLVLADRAAAQAASA